MSFVRAFFNRLDPFIELSARPLAFSRSGSGRSISCGLPYVSFQVTGAAHFSFQLLQGNAVFLQEVHQHLCMAQQFGILSTKM